MKDNEKKQDEEYEYLEKTLDFLRNEISKGNELISNRRDKLIASRRDMWENSAHFSTDFAKMTEVNQHLTEVDNQTRGYLNKLNMIEKYEKIIKSPYFGRFDFKEAGSEDVEKIYIGMQNVMDEQTYNIFIYDWRAPISSIFYQYELGRAIYKSPTGDINGEVSLKRQYKIEDSKLRYFFDSSIRITDEMLQEVLCRNASAKMKNIVETIQKEQDIIIRDTDNELLVVQGVAGSGKTSIALHRIAFLLYYGTGSGLGSNNIMIISPNLVFSKYISSVLPELGEENVNQITFDEIISKYFDNRFTLENRALQLENLILSSNKNKPDIRISSLEFKGSMVFVKILQRLILYYERRLIAIEDIYYDNKVVESKENIKNLLLNNKINMPLGKRLKRIENRILENIKPMQKERLKKIEKIVEKSDGHEFEIKSFSRLLSIKEGKNFLRQLHKFTQLDYFSIYKMLFMKEELLFQLSKGFVLPNDIKQIILETKKNLENDNIKYEDSAPLLYVKLLVEGSDVFSEIKQVVIDEAQDYHPLQYEIFNLMFKEAKYTVLGDISQTIERDLDKSIYDTVTEIFNKRKAVKLFLNKSYRSSCEICDFNQKIINRNKDIISFERHEEEPMVIMSDTQDIMDRTISYDINQLLKQGYESLAVICKTQKEAKVVHGRLNKFINTKLADSAHVEIEKGVWVMPSYISKGLEFDCVIVYDVSKKNYSSQLDRRLLYIACTRALHRLLLYYIGNPSPFV